MLWIYKRIPRPKPYQPGDVIAIDINERKIVYGSHEINKDIDTAVDRLIDGRSLRKICRKNTPPQDTRLGGGEGGS